MTTDTTIAWGDPRRARSRGLSLFVGGGRDATVSKELYGPLENRRVVFGMTGDGKVVLRIQTNPEAFGWTVRNRQVVATPLLNFGVPHRTRLWFRWDDDGGYFIETRRQEETGNGNGQD